MDPHPLDPQSSPLGKKSSFYYPLLLLPKGQRKALETLYRFCWLVDDWVDRKDGKIRFWRRQLALKHLRRDLSVCFSGKVDFGKDRGQKLLFQYIENGTLAPLFLELARVIRDFGLSREPFFRLLEGAESDLRSVRSKTFEDLHKYALQVAGGPGLASMEIFGFKDARHRVYAENLGVFLQVVNVVRDFREDAALGRLYLPSEDFKKFHLNPSHIEERNSHWKPFVEFQLDRAWGFLEKARKSLTLQERSALPTAEAIAAVYGKLHQKLRNHPDLILKSRVSLSKSDKALSTLGALGRCFLWRTGVSRA